MTRERKIRRKTRELPANKKKSQENIIKKINWLKMNSIHTFVFTTYMYLFTDTKRAKSIGLQTKRFEISSCFLLLLFIRRTNNKFYKKQFCSLLFLGITNGFALVLKNESREFVYRIGHKGCCFAYEVHVAHSGWSVHVI